ncbi:MAG: hypothetical protein Q9M36_02995 [Sulfurovum sp.]|nr:hypothetical protein [Sulfurovum sp.]
MAINSNRGFILKTTITKIDTIKPRKADSFKNSNGEEITYGYAVKFKSRSIELVYDELFW